MKKFKSPEKNFRKMFIQKCQSIFDNNFDNEYDTVLKDVDEEERKQKHKLRLLGNMKLIGELYIRGALNDNVLVQCFNKLLSLKSEDSLENMCQLILKVGEKLYLYYAYMQG